MTTDITVTLTYTEEEAREVARAFLYFTSNVSATHEDQDRMTLIRSAIKAALPPPKPDEPQAWLAVVEDADGMKWFTHRDDPTVQWDKPWYCQDIAEYRDWSDIATERNAEWWSE